MDTSPAFARISPGYDAAFRAGRLSVGLVVPIEAYPHARSPGLDDLHAQAQRIQRAEALGFAAVWLRDVPFDVPAFGDAGQLYDPFVYLGLLAGQTQRIALGVASVVLPLRHPAHVAKAAASADALSGGRLILGIASGDRAEEYPAMGLDHATRGERFRSSYDYIRQMADGFPAFDNAYGTSHGGVDMLPKPAHGRLPLMITGGSQQSPDWLARHGDGWMVYPRDPSTQADIITQWRERGRAAGVADRPAMQPLYVDLADDPDAPPTPIHLGFRVGVRGLTDYLAALQDGGVNHVALNLRFNRAAIDATLDRLAADVLPAFHA